MIRVGLTGGIGSGKSTVARMLADRGAVIIDADAIARELVEPGQPALDALVAEFGPSIVDDRGLRRSELARIAFADPSATKRLNAIMHPLIRAESERRLAQSRADVVVYDMPLLVETGQQALVDRVIVVDVPVEVQIERAVGTRGLDEEDVRRRIAVQATREQRLSLADDVVDNAASREATEAQVQRIWESLTAH